MSDRYIKAKYIFIDIIMISTLCNKFEELVEKSFIIPKEINKDIKNMAFLNMNRKIFSEEEIKIKYEEPQKEENVNIPEEKNNLKEFKKENKDIKIIETTIVLPIKEKKE